MLFLLLYRNVGRRPLLSPSHLLRESVTRGMPSCLRHSRWPCRAQRCRRGCPRRPCRPTRVSSKRLQFGRWDRFLPVRTYGAPEERVSGQFLDKDRIKRGQSEVKVRIYPYFRHPLSLPSLYLPIHLTFSSVHPTQCPYPEFIHSLSSVWSSNIPQTFSSSWWQSWKLWITTFVCELQCKCWLYPQLNRALT